MIDMNERHGGTGGAMFDGTHQYRYLLWREVSRREGSVLFVMLNPNQADESKNDPTIRRCIGFADRWGYGRLEVVNLFAHKAPTPTLLRSCSAPVGNENDRVILEAVARSALVVVAWGNHGSHLDRDASVLSLIAPFCKPHCLDVNLTGKPCHPLYCRKTLEPKLFSH